MTDREVVITHLDDLRLFADVTVHPVVSPDNWNVYSSLCDYIDQIKEDVEILLKEQEAVEARKKTNGIPQPWASWWYVCGDCGQEIEYHDRFCRWCGRKVKWNEID